jgi:hypothetical protein
MRDKTNTPLKVITGKSGYKSIIKGNRVVAAELLNGKIRNEYDWTYPNKLAFWLVMQKRFMKFWQWAASLHYLSRDDREEIYNDITNQVKAYYEFCFDKQISDATLENIIPSSFIDGL